MWWAKGILPCRRYGVPVNVGPLPRSDRRPETLNATLKHKLFTLKEAGSVSCVGELNESALRRP